MPKRNGFCWFALVFVLGCSDRPWDLLTAAARSNLPDIGFEAASPPAVDPEFAELAALENQEVSYTKSGAEVFEWAEAGAVRFSRPNGFFVKKIMLEDSAALAVNYRFNRDFLQIATPDFFEQSPELVIALFDLTDPAAAKELLQTEETEETTINGKTFYRALDVGLLNQVVYYFPAGQKLFKFTFKSYPADFKDPELKRIFDDGLMLVLKSFAVF
jgi:hypothetical protein